MYGFRLLVQTPAVVALLPAWVQVAVPFLITVISYFILVVALLAWVELSVGKLRSFTRIMVFPALLIGIAGTTWFVFTGSSDELMPYNNLVALCVLLVLTVVVIVPKLSAGSLSFPNPVLTVGTLIFTAEALYINLSGTLNLSFRSPRFIDELVFAIFLFSFAYVAARKVFANEHRLVLIEGELEIAREIQNTILPASVPAMKNLSIAATYRPMTAVAGDFYDYIQRDEQHLGVFVADVSGHGVPAALIASMIKVAMQSVVSCGDDPPEVLRRLSRTLSDQLRGQFVSAAYLWFDMEVGIAKYSAAGHPPLICWRKDKLQRIESNGLLFGVMADTDYPVCDIPLEPGARFLLYTDGVIEPENTAGESFGDYKLEQIVRENWGQNPGIFSVQLLAEIAKWQPASMTQQDDITLIVIDVLEGLALSSLRENNPATNTSR